MKKIVYLAGCFALLSFSFAMSSCSRSGSACDQTTDPNNHYDEPLGNDTISIASNYTIDSSQWEYKPSTNQFVSSFDDPDRNDPYLVDYIMDVQQDGQWYETPAYVEGGAKISLVKTPTGFNVVLSTTGKDAPWIPQFITLNFYVVLEPEDEGYKLSKPKHSQINWKKPVTTSTSRPLFTKQFATQ